MPPRWRCAAQGRYTCFVDALLRRKIDEIEALEALLLSAGLDEDDADGDADGVASEDGSAQTEVYIPAEQIRLHRMRVLRRTARELHGICSIRFNQHMAQLGHAGRLVVNFQNGELRLEVQVSGRGDTASPVTTFVPGSGVDEYASISFVLSLMESSDSPFCALDAWDAVADPAVRAQIHAKVASYAGDHPEKQFILVTPHHVALEPSEAVSIFRIATRRF